METDDGWVTDPRILLLLFELRGFENGDLLRFLDRVGAEYYDSVANKEVFMDYKPHRENLVAWKRPKKRTG